MQNIFTSVSARPNISSLTLGLISLPVFLAASDSILRIAIRLDLLEMSKSPLGRYSASSLRSKTISRALSLISMVFKVIFVLPFCFLHKESITHLGADVKTKISVKRVILSLF